MKWESIKVSAEQEFYHLYKDGEKRLTVIFNPFSQSARVECRREKRIFLIRKEGFLRNKTIIRNEYGVKMGEFGITGNDHYILLNDEKIYYCTQNNPLAELVLFKDKKQPLITCGLTNEMGGNHIYFKKDKNLGTMPHPGLLMALTWYMFLPVAKENEVEALP